MLFDELKLPVQGKTGITGGRSTDQETLEKLAALDVPGSPLPRKILEHRQIAKLKGTYVDALPELVNPDTGRVHASFNQTVAATGRLSSSATRTCRTSRCAASRAGRSARRFCRRRAGRC